MITIDSVIRGYMGDKQAPTLHGYVPLLNYALEGFKELSYDVISEVKTTAVTLDAIKIGKMPTDYVKLVRCYAKVGDRMVEMSEDGSITFHKKDAVTPNDKYSERRSENRGGGRYSLGYSETNPLNGIDTSSYGVGHNNFGYFREKKGTYPVEFHFSSEVTSKSIFVEYLATPTVPGTETLLTPLASKCLNEYIGYKESRYRNGEASVETQSRKMNFEDERRKLFARESNLSLTSIADAYKKAYGEQHLR
jgi:hypothetical protein